MLARCVVFGCRDFQFGLGLSFYFIFAVFLVVLRRRSAFVWLLTASESGELELVCGLAHARSSFLVEVFCVVHVCVTRCAGQSFIHFSQG